MLFLQKTRGQWMSRTTLYKAHYFGTIAVLGLCALWLLYYSELSPICFIVLLVTLVLPGRVLGFFWRDLLRGLRLLNTRQFAESRRHSQLFLQTLHKRPHLRKLVWLGSSTYSRNPEVLALNNLGAAELHLGEIESAKEHLARATMIDRKCPLPYFNMGLIYILEENVEEAERCFQKAARLGYKNRLSDRIVKAAQARFARSDGMGVS